MGNIENAGVAAEVTVRRGIDMAEIDMEGIKGAGDIMIEVVEGDLDRDHCRMIERIAEIENGKDEEFTETPMGIEGDGAVVMTEAEARAVRLRALFTLPDKKLKPKS